MHQLLSNTALPFFRATAVSGRPKFAPGRSRHGRSATEERRLQYFTLSIIIYKNIYKHIYYNRHYSNWNAVTKETVGEQRQEKLLSTRLTNDISEPLQNKKKGAILQETVRTAKNFNGMKIVAQSDAARERKIQETWNQIWIRYKSAKEMDIGVQGRHTWSGKSST